MNQENLGKENEKNDIKTHLLSYIPGEYYQFFLSYVTEKKQDLSGLFFVEQISLLQSFKNYLEYHIFLSIVRNFSRSCSGETLQKLEKRFSDFSAGDFTLSFLDDQISISEQDIKSSNDTYFLQNAKQEFQMYSDFKLRAREYETFSLEDFLHFQGTHTFAQEKEFLGDIEVAITYPCEDILEKNVLVEKNNISNKVLSLIGAGFLLFSTNISQGNIKNTFDLETSYYGFFLSLAQNTIQTMGFLETKQLEKYFSDEITRTFCNKYKENCSLEDLEVNIQIQGEKQYFFIAFTHMKNKQKVTFFL